MKEVRRDGRSTREEPVNQTLSLGADGCRAQLIQFALLSPAPQRAQPTIVFDVQLLPHIVELYAFTRRFRANLKTYMA